MKAVLLCLLLSALSGQLSAQQPDSSARPPARPSAPDTARRAPRDTGIGPIGAMLRSMLVPGWGQAVVGRRVTAAAFVLWEGVAWTMAIKAQDEVNYLKRTGSRNLGSKRQEVEDWVVLLVFNHLFAGAEAFVSAHLREFPQGLEIRAAPRGVGVQVRVPLP